MTNLLSQLMTLVQDFLEADTEEKDNVASSLLADFLEEHGEPNHVELAKGLRRGGVVYCLPAMDRMYRTPDDVAWELDRYANTVRCPRDGFTNLPDDVRTETSRSSAANWWLYSWRDRCPWCQTEQLTRGLCQACRDAFDSHSEKDRWRERDALSHPVGVDGTT